MTHNSKTDRSKPEHPCLFGMAVIISDAAMHPRNKLIRLESLRVYYAYVEPLDIPEHDSDIRFGVAGASVVDGKLLIGGSDNSLGFWSGLDMCDVACRQCQSRLIPKGRDRRRCPHCHTSAMGKKTQWGRQPWTECLVGSGFRYSSRPMSKRSLHISALSKEAQICDKLKHALLEKQEFTSDRVELPSTLFATPSVNVANPTFAPKGMARILQNWFNGELRLSTSLSPVAGTIYFIKRNQLTQALEITINKNRVLFPNEFEPLVKVDSVATIGTALAAPKQLTQDEFIALPQKTRMKLTELIIDGAAYGSGPLMKEEGRYQIYDFTLGRKRGAIFYPIDLIKSEDIGAIYVDCSTNPLDEVQMWDLDVQARTSQTKCVINQQALIDRSPDVPVQYDFYNSPRRTLVDEYVQTQPKR